MSQVLQLVWRSISIGVATSLCHLKVDFRHPSLETNTSKTPTLITTRALAKITYSNRAQTFSKRSTGNSLGYSIEFLMKLLPTPIHSDDLKLETYIKLYMCGSIYSSNLKRVLDIKKENFINFVLSYFSKYL